MSDTQSVNIKLNDISTTLTQNISVILRYTSLAVQGAETGNLAGDAKLPGTWFGFNTGPMDDATLKELRAGAEAWILQNAFRTLTAMIEVALDRTWNYCGLLALGKGRLAPIEEVVAHNARLEKFQEFDFPTKIERLRQDYGPTVLPPDTEVIETFRNVRNCLEHQHGVVSARKPKRLVNGNLELQWKYITITAVQDSGQETLIVPGAGMGGALPAGGLKLSGPAKIRQQVLTHTKRFPVGTPVTITRQELTEMCLTTHLWGTQLANAVIQFVQSLPTPPASPSPGPTE